ncbi:hypothetical protein K503DRAFT_805199 [Rhizopogon vinicolor AM-OR11-026]|uniref:Uncharacterized protein n=1 Tax=Rhizopogon vinicolor AM-OR11-026 TaxID=1314800 RepID=A0A1B7MIQ0_9AGAM|nr:hypothetical protein K503DRAFT_805199 [Rhizopogon vinicolor AM-OR11-026]
MGGINILWEAGSSLITHRIRSNQCQNPSSLHTTAESEEEYTLTGFGEEQTQPSEPRPFKRLRLKVKRTPFPTKRIGIQDGSSSPSTPTSPISPSVYIDALNKRFAAYREQLDATESDTLDPAEPTSSESGECLSPTSSTSSGSYKPGQSVIVKAVPSVAESPEQPKGWKKLPPRLPIPKWDVEG